MKWWLAGAMCAFLSFAPSHAGAENLRKTAEATVLVTGQIEINQDGSVKGYTLDHPEKLPPEAIQLAQQSLPLWKFKMDPGQVDSIKAKMSLRVVGKRLDDKHFTLSITGAQFGDVDPTTAVGQKDRVPVKYPMDMALGHVSGNVYLVVRINQDGQVQDIAAEQVNLKVLGSERDMARFRKSLADSSIEAVKQWTFNPPAKGKDTNASRWVIRVPISFTLIRDGQPLAPDIGGWEIYIPGPREYIPWLDDQSILTAAPDAASENELHTLGASPQLLTQLGGS